MNKKVLLFGMVALLFATFSCKKTETETSTIEASIVSEDDGSRTYLYNDNRVGWSPNDVIRVWGATGDQKDYTLTDNSTDPRNGTFSCGHGGVQQGNSYLGFYPTAIFTSRSGDNITFTTSGTQTYAENTFNNNVNPMVAKASTPKLPFKNVFGLMKIELKGNYTVTKIELSDPSNALWGQFTVTAGTSPLTVTKPARTAENSVLTMTCSKTLDGTNATNFYFMVPPGAFSNGFTIKVYRGTNGSTLVDTYTTASAHTISSNHIKIVQATSTITIPQVTNLLPELTSDYAGWSIEGNPGGGQPSIAIPTIAYTNDHYTNEATHPSGTYCYLLENPNTVVECFVKSRSAISYKQDHLYYVRWMSRKEKWTINGGLTWSYENMTCFSQDVFWPADASHQWVNSYAGVNNAGYLWEQNSKVFTHTSTGSNYIRFDFNNRFNGTNFVFHFFCFSDAMLIDLTADYTNQGYPIPTKAELDAKPYFIGQRPVDSW